MCVTFIDILYNDYEMTFCCYCKFDVYLMYCKFDCKVDVSSPSAAVYLQLCFTITIPRSYVVVVKSLSESTTIPLIVLSDSDDASEACTVVKNTNVKLEEVNFINTKFRFLNSLNK